MSFKDHFSGHAAIYRDARPHYSPALFDRLAHLAPRRELAWDAGCGNGQASVALAAHFGRVVATDPSAQQIANAMPHERVEYRVEPAEQPTLPDDCVDLVTVAQALHWFDVERFYAQVRRVARADALIAVWTYAHCRIATGIDALVDDFYGNVVGPYWPPERRHTESGYATLPFPFAPVAIEPFDLEAHWDCAQFIAYLRSWSATQRYRAARGNDPVATLEPALIAAWGDPSLVRTVSWALSIRVGRCHDGGSGHGT